MDRAHGTDFRLGDRASVDGTCGRRYSCGVVSAVWRGSAAILVASWLVVSPTLAPAHIHEADADHDHSLVHRHLEVHHQLAAGNQLEIETPHDDGRVVW